MRKFTKEKFLSAFLSVRFVVIVLCWQSRSIGLNVPIATAAVVSQQALQVH